MIWGVESCTRICRGLFAGRDFESCLGVMILTHDYPKPQRAKHPLSSSEPADYQWLNFLLVKNTYSKS